MILLILSFIFIVISSFFIASILSKSDAVKGFVYLLLIAYAQVITTSLILSPFHQIKEIPFLTVNFLFFIISFFIWKKYKKPLWKPELKGFQKRFFNALKLDKSLWILFISWVFFIAISLYLAILLPTTSGDAYSYHVVRSYDWVLNHTLEHFNTHDIRITSFPINSELLYMWVILFTKKQFCLGIFSFIGYFLTMICGYGILKYIGFSMRKTLWTLFIISSFASVVVMISGTETDLIVAGLITSAIYLFINAIKNKSDNKTLFMASLTYAISIGIKTPAIICIPAVGLILLYFSFLNKDKKSIFKFIGFGIINFIIFSSYNYILNFFSFTNPMGDIGSITAHKNLWGIKGFIANCIKHFFLFFDFSGIKLPSNAGDALIELEKNVLTFFKVNEVPNGIYCGTGFFNRTLIEPVMGYGILGFLLVLPCIARTLIEPIFNKNKLVIAKFIFSLALIINIATLSYLISFMTYNTRFLTTFILISMPIIACSYIKSNKNFIKILYILIAMFYLIVVSTHLWGRPFTRLVKNQIEEPCSIKEFRSKIICRKFDKRKKSMDENCVLYSLFVSKFLDKDYKILIFSNFADGIIFTKTMKLQGYDIDFNNLESLKSINTDIYDIIIYPIKGQAVTNFEKYTPDKIEYVLDFNTKNIYPKDIKSETLCYYNSLDGTLAKELGNDNQIPIHKVCKLTTNFFNNHPFKFGYRTDNNFILLNTNTFKD